MNFVLFGAPGAGKGTQSHLLQKEFGFTPLSTGELLRKEIAKDTPLGQEINNIIVKGGFANDGLILEMLKGALKEVKGPVIFDGFPRTEVQAKILINEFHAKDYPITAVLVIDIDEQSVIKRILGRYSCNSCGQIYNEYFYNPKVKGLCDHCNDTNFTTRKDDTYATVQARYKTYIAETTPVLNILQDHIKIIRINGANASDVVYKEICKTIKDYIK